MAHRWTVGFALLLLLPLLPAGAAAESALGRPLLLSTAVDERGVAEVATVETMRSDGSGRPALGSLAYGAVAVGVLAAPAAVRADGDLLASGFGGRLYTVSAAGDVVRTIVNDGHLNSDSAVWSPDGARIAYSSSGSRPGGSAIFVVNADGTGLHAVATAVESSNVQRPVWISPTELAFHRSQGAFPRGSLWIVAIEGGTPRMLVDPADGSLPAAMQPHGSLLVYSRSARDGRPRRALVDVRSGVSRQLPSETVDTAWSPDGSQLALAGYSGLELVRADGAGRRTLLGGVQALWPSWSPDGGRIAFTVRREFPEFHSRFGTPIRSEIWTVGANGTGLTRLTGIAGDGVFTPVDPVGSYTASWWPDGSRLFFRTQRATNAIGSNWMANADGSCEQSWAPALGTFYVPQWRPGTTATAGRLECTSVTVRLRPPPARVNPGYETGVRGALPLTVVVRNDGTRPVNDLRVALDATRGSLAVRRRSCGGGRQVVCELRTLAPGAEMRFVADASVRAAGPLTLTAAATYADAPDVFAADDRSVAAVTVLPCDLLGTWLSDRLTGTRRGERICGRPGHDRIDGGRGNDQIDAGSGYDTVTGGPGRDSILGGGGFDLIRVRDGERDVVECGTESDSVVADQQDTVARDCELVSRR